MSIVRCPDTGVRAALVLTALVLLVSCKSQKTQAGGPPAMTVPVTVATALKETVPADIRVVGTVEPSSKVEVKSMVAGQITKVHFTEGQDVSQGQLLFDIDARPYQEALRQAQAAVERDRAQLAQAKALLLRDQAQAKSADVEAQRYSALLKDRLVSQQQELQYATSADTAREAVRADQAAVESAQAAMNLDVTLIDKAKLDLSYCQIHAPIAGRAGNVLVQEGNLVKVNDVALVVINRLSPVFVSFNAPDPYLDEIRRNNARSPLAVEVTTREGTTVKERGRLAVIDNTVDTQTGTIHLKATFENNRRALWPGQFVDVVLTLNRAQSVTVIPSEAVQAGQKGQFVYVVKPDKTVEPRIVAVGRTMESKVVINQGVNAGETVVTDGQMMLFPGARIMVVPAPKAPAGAL
ncbi:MAG: efflux RND transporter periplasmic adaptor subunit [Acidobacteriaceae bacterium]|nr:efflux RND transporter periplasmic adaptor subunit [Acidobacteriaceae bacterium]